VALPFPLKCILRQRQNYENSNISTCKNVIFKKSSKRNQNPSRYYNSITNLKFQHNPKYHLSRNPHIKIDLFGRCQNPLSYYTLIVNLNTISYARPTNEQLILHPVDNPQNPVRKSPKHITNQKEFYQTKTQNKNSPKKTTQNKNKNTLRRSCVWFKSGLGIRV
jgi:hypothetical protein